MEMNPQQDILWKPSSEDIANSRLMEYRHWLKQNHNIETKDYESLWKWSVDELELFWQTPLSSIPPNGENLETFFNRVNNAWKDIQTQQYCDHTLILCHGGTIRMVLAALLNIPLESALFQQLHIDYCSQTRIDISDHPDAKPIIRWIGTPL